MSMVTPKKGLNIPAGFDISLSKFGQFFHPGAKFLYKLPHPREIPKISKQNNLKLFIKIKLISQSWSIVIYWLIEQLEEKIHKIW